MKKILVSVASEDLSSKDIDLIYKKNKEADKTDIKVSFVGNTTLDVISRNVIASALCRGISISEYVAPYGQYQQEALNPQSGLYAAKPSVIFFQLSLRELSPDIYYQYSSLSSAEHKAEAARIIDECKQWVQMVSKSTKSMIMVANFAMPARKAYGIADTKSEAGESAFYAHLNTMLSTAFKKDPRVVIYDLAGAVNRFGSERACDDTFYYLSKIEWSDDFMRFMAADIARYIQVIKGCAMKCLVVDLDNTLWDGIVGEDGPQGVLIGQGNPQAEAFRAFQYAIKSLKARGILLAICSKNNMADVEELFKLRASEMPLSLDDFSAIMVDWEPKAVNIAKIAGQLNIGLDSIVFIDDNPAECELMREAQPDVMTIQLSDDPVEYAPLIYSLPCFERLTITAEDATKSIQYKQQRKREEEKSAITDINEYLHSLGTSVRVYKPNTDQLARVHQLFIKTNQFNVTTKRYDIGDIEIFYKDNNCILHVVEAEDKFGNLGIIGTYLVKIENKEAVIDSFIISCRALGRGIEAAAMGVLKKCIVHGAWGIDKIKAEYVPTKKNMPCKTFFDEHGFEVVMKLDDGTVEYECTDVKGSITETPWIEVIRKT
ncbi:MAG: HAD family hydrolase [Candidatus Omnitrophica bacterium]|nr:HAD family hydrolase [Candidatus Omnitrophota bacterium]